MSKALCTFATGEMKPVLRRTLPFMASYAGRHGYDLYVEPEWMVPDLRPVSWHKLAVIQSLLWRNDLVLWLDADFLIVDESEDVADFFTDPTSPIGVCTHHTKMHGLTPNCGLILARDADFIASLDQDVETDKFAKRIWEQARLWRAVGIDPTCANANTRPPEQKTFNWTELPRRFNFCMFEERGEPDNLRFIHLAGYNNMRRVETIERMVVDMGLRR